MTGKKIDNLLRLLDRIEAGATLATLTLHERGSSGFSGGAYVFRMAGVSGSSTMSMDAALDSWVRAAQRRVAKASGEVLR